MSYYDKNGHPIDLLTMGRLAEDKKYKVIKQTTLNARRSLWISTVWLGSDHQFGKGPPLIFETMVFPSRNDMSELFCARYATEREAKIGHEIVLVQLKHGVQPESLKCL